jgi:hypothetical protein
MKTLILLILCGTAFGQIVMSGDLRASGDVTLQTQVVPALDAVSGGGTTNQTTSLTWSHTVGASANLLFIFITTLNGHAISTLTVNGSATGVTAVTTEADGNGSSLTSMYAMTSPPTGSVSIVATPSASDGVVGAAISLTGTNQTYATPVKANGKNTTGQPSAAATAVPANDLVVSDVGTSLAGLFSTYTFTSGGPPPTSQQQQGGAGTNDAGNVIGTATGVPGSVPLTWTIATGATPWYWAEIVVDVHHQ